MHTRTKKLIGTFIIVTLALLYAVIATTIAAAKLADAHWAVHLVYFVVSGFLWVVPAMFVISWMIRPSKAEMHEKQ